MKVMRCVYPLFNVKMAAGEKKNLRNLDRTKNISPPTLT